MKRLVFILILATGTFAAAQSTNYAAMAQQLVSEFNAEIAALDKPPDFDETYQGPEPSAVDGWIDYYATTQSKTQYVIVHVPNTGGQIEVMFTGDSITQWMHWVDQLPQISWANMAIAGQTCHDMAARFQSDIAIVQPRIVVIACGTIDAYKLGTTSSSIAAIS